MPERGAGGEAPRRLGDFLRASQAALVADWLARARALSPARELPQPALADHLPQLLAQLAEIVSARAGAARDDAPRLHADRLARGFDLGEVVREYGLLRRCILDRWEREVGAAIAVSELRRLDDALDQAIAESAASFARARERTLEALDRISEAALGSSDLGALLTELLAATLTTAEAVDSAAVLLREGDLLRTRAAVGLEAEVERGSAVRVGEGFAGAIAAEARPILLKNAAADPPVKSAVIPARGPRARYGVPLSHAGEVIGVAHIGSRTADEFSAEDKLLFRAMASRATGLIVQARLVADLEGALGERDRLVSQLAGERRRLEQVLQQLPTGVLITEAPAGRIVFGNKRCEEILGRPFPPAAGDGEPGWQPFHPDGAPYRDDELPRMRALRGEEVVDEFKVQRPDGAWVMIRTTAAPLRDEAGRIQGAVVAFDDISEQKRREESLRFLSNASRRLAESIDYEETLARIAALAVPGLADWFAVELVDDGGVRPLVAAHADPAKAALARELRRRFPPDLDAPRGLGQAIRTGRPELFEEIPDALLAAGARSEEHLRVMRELGMRSAMIVPLSARGRAIGAITLVSAESGRRYGPRDVEAAQGFADRAAIALENARLYREAEAAIRLREEVLAVVSHDLRNPLGAMTMSAAVLLKRLAADARTRKQVETIQRAASRMEHLIGDLLDTASLQAGRLAVERTPQELAPIFAEAVQFAEPLARENALTLTSEIALGGARGAVDRERLLQVLANLLGNAKKFCPPGGAIAVRARVRGDEVECRVSDTGPGIPEAELPHLFEPYWSAKRHRKEGVGLGLYISKGIVEAHGGRIWAESRLGAGAAFYFTLPLAPPAS